MKYQHDRFKYANSDRIDPNDSQFLTFRNTQQDTGRSVFSQKVQGYKFLQKGNTQQIHDTPIRNFKKNQNFRSIRSQDKFYNKGLIAIKKENTNSQQNEQNYLNDIDNNQFEFRNELLRKKTHKIVKNIKSQQRKQISLEKQIQDLQKQLDEDQQQIQNQNVQIEELQAINEQNSLYLDKLIDTFQDFQNKNLELQKVVQDIEDSLQNIVKTSRQQDSKNKMAHKLKQGLLKLENLRNQVSNRCLRMECQVQRMREFIDQTYFSDSASRDTTYSRQTQNNSHFTC